MKCNRDYSVVTYDSEIVSRLSDIFQADFDGKPWNVSEALESPGGEKITVSHNSRENLIKFIDSAASTLRIQNQYLKEPDLNAAILRAAERGVVVEITLSSVCIFGAPSQKALAAASQIFKEFDDAGVSLSMFTRLNRIGNKPGYMHAKVIIVDDKSAWVGSNNGSTKAMNFNREFGIKNLAVTSSSSDLAVSPVVPAGLHL